MARGNQREVARAKTQAKLQSQSKPKDGNPMSRNLNDSAALAVKVAQKAELKKLEEEAAARAASGQPVLPKKKIAKEDAALDDLLSAGLTGKKK